MGIYCEVYGNTIENKVLEHLLIFRTRDVAVGDIAEFIGISRPKAYEIIYMFEKKGYISKSRLVGKTQLYKLNESDVLIKIFLRNFKECMKLPGNKVTYSRKESMHA